MPPTVFFLLRIDLAMRALFWFYMKFKVVFSSSVKVIGSLKAIVSNLQITLGGMAVFIILILTNHEHGIFLYLCPLLFP